MSVSGPTYLNNKPLVSKKKNFGRKKNKDKDYYIDNKHNADTKPKGNDTHESVS